MPLIIRLLPIWPPQLCITLNTLRRSLLTHYGNYSYLTHYLTFYPGWSELQPEDFNSTTHAVQNGRIHYLVPFPLIVNLLNPSLSSITVYTHKYIIHKSRISLTNTNQFFIAQLNQILIINKLIILRKHFYSHSMCLVCF